MHDAGLYLIRGVIIAAYVWGSRVRVVLVGCIYLGFGGGGGGGGGRGDDDDVDGNGGGGDYYSGDAMEHLHLWRCYGLAVALQPALDQWRAGHRLWHQVMMMVVVVVVVVACVGVGERRGVRGLDDDGGGDGGGNDSHGDADECDFLLPTLCVWQAHVALLGPDIFPPSGRSAHDL